MFCRECGKEIEEGARFCRFCGKPQQAASGSVERVKQTVDKAPARPRPDVMHRLRQLFPRHHWQDDFSHIATIAAVIIAVVGFLIGLFPGLGGQIYGITWLLFSIFLVLFLMLRESTLSHARGTRPTELAPGRDRYHAARRDAPSVSPDREGTTAQSVSPSEPGSNTVGSR